MDEQERRRRLRAYGFSAGERQDDPSSGSGVSGPDAPEPGPIPGRGLGHAGLRDASVATSRQATGTLPGPGVVARIVDSLGFRFGLVVLTLAFVLGAAMTLELLPDGPLADAAAAFFVLTLTPLAGTSWMAVGVLAPPAPFRTGLLLGLYGAALLAVLLFMEDAGSGDASVAGVLGYSLTAVVVASLTTGIVGWIVRRVFMPPSARLSFREQAGLEPRARPWPPLVIAVASVSLPLGVFTDETNEWVFAAAFASVITVAMIRGGLDVQRRYPERRTPVIVVGLFAGIIAGLAMLQAIWTESRWPERRVSSDRIAIGVSVLLVVAAAYAAADVTESGPQMAWRGGQEYVVQPAPGLVASQEDVELSADILEARLTALDIAAYLSTGDNGRIVVQVPADADAGLVERVLGSVGLLEFTPVPPGCILFIEPDEPAPRCLAGAEPLFDGTEVAAARIGQDQTTGEVVVNLEFKEAGARLFDEHAEEHLGDHFAIVLDGIVETAPSINATRFGGQAQISGGFTVEEASALVAALQAGRSLPYAVSVTET